MRLRFRPPMGAGLEGAVLEGAVLEGGAVEEARPACTKILNESGDCDSHRCAPIPQAASRSV